MAKIDWKRKLSSRKLWAAAAGIVTGLAMVFGLDESYITDVAGAVVSAASPCDLHHHRGPRGRGGGKGGYRQ